MTDVSSLPLKENIESQKAKIAGWPTETRYNQQYHEVQKHYCFHINFDSMYDQGQKFSDFKLEGEAPYDFISMMMFSHTVEQACFNIGLPGLREQNEAVRTGANAGGRGVKKIYVDKNGDVLHSDSRPKKKKVTIPGGLVGIVESTSTSISVAYETKRKLQGATMEEIKLTITATKKYIEKKKKEIQKAINEGTNRSMPPLRLNQPVDADSDDEGYIHEGTCVILPPIEVVVEYVYSCNYEWKTRNLMTISAKQKMGKKSREREPDHDDFALLDNNSEEEDFYSTDEEDAPVRKKPILAQSGDDTMGTFSFTETLGKPQFTSKKDLKLFDELWGNQSDSAMKNPKFKAFIESCSRMYGTGCIGMTFHVFIRDKNVDFGRIVFNQLRKNMQEYFQSIRSTAEISMKQNLFLAIGVEVIDGERGENEVIDRFLEDEQGDASKLTQQLKRVKLPPPKNRNSNVKRNPLNNFEYHTIPRKPEQWGFLRDVYVKDGEFQENKAALSVDYSFQDMDNCLNANRIFTLENAIARRPRNCQYDEWFWDLLPKTYVDYSTYDRDAGMTVRIPGVHVAVEPESIFPANLVNKTLPHVDSASYSAIEKMYPSLCTSHDKESIMLHYNTDTYPYDPSVVPPPRIGEKYLTISEIEAAKKWLFGAWGIDPCSKHWHHNMPLFSDDENDPSNDHSIQALRSSMNIDLRSNQQDLIKTPRFIQYAHPLELTKQLRTFFRSLRDTRRKARIRVKQAYARDNMQLPGKAELKMIVEAQARSIVDFMALRNVQRNYTSFLMDEYPDDMIGRNGHLMNTLEKINNKVLHGLKKSFTGIPDNIKAQRAMYLIYQKNAVDLYDLTARGSHSNISDAGLVILECERTGNLMQSFQRRPMLKYDISKSNMLNTLGNLLYVYERYFFAFRPGLVFEIWLCSMDATRHEFGTHLDLMLSGDGAASKSHSAKLVIRLRCSIAGGNDSVAMRTTTEEVTSSSEKVNQIDSQGLTNHMMTIDNEMAREKLMDHSEGGGANAEWKKLMDEHCTVTHAAFLDNMNRVVKRIRRMEKIGVFINIMNFSLMGTEDSGTQRSLQKTITDPINTDKTIQELQTREEQSKGTEDGEKAREYATQHHIIQATMYHLHMALKTKIVTTSSFVGMYVILQVCNDVHKKIGIEINPRASKYLLLGGMAFEFLDIIIGEFFSPGGRFYKKNITMDSIRALEPQLFMNTHHVVASIGTLYKYIMPQGLTEVRRALSLEFMNKVAAAGQGYQPHFKMNRLYTDRQQDNNTGNNNNNNNNDNSYQPKHQSHSNNQYTVDWRYVRFNLSLQELAARIVGHMKNGEMGTTEVYAVRHVQFVLWNLSKCFITSKKYKANDLKPFDPPEVVGTDTETIPICEFNEKSWGVNIAYDFVNQPRYDLERCIKESLRDIFDAQNQPVYDYMWGFNNDCRSYFDTFRLGEGISSRNILKHKPLPGPRKQLIFPNLNFNSAAHLKYLSEGTDDDIPFDRRTVKEITMDKTPSILIDTSLDKFGFMKHAKMCCFPYDEVLTKREMMSTLYHYNEILTAASNIATDVSGLNQKDKKIFKEILRDIIEPIKEKAKNKNRKEQGIPDSFVKLSTPAENEVLFGDESPESQAVKRILELMDDTDDMDIKPEQFMVPLFENEPKCFEEYYASEGKKKPVFIKMTEHWKALGMTVAEYKSEFALFTTREDRFNRANILQGAGADVYPHVIIEEAMTIKKAKSVIEKIQHDQTGKLIKKYLYDPKNPFAHDGLCVIPASTLFGKRPPTRKIAIPQIHFTKPDRITQAKRAQKLREMEERERKKLNDPNVGHTGGRARALEKILAQVAEVEEIKKVPKRKKNKELFDVEKLPVLPDCELEEYIGRRTSIIDLDQPKRGADAVKQFDLFDMMPEDSNSMAPTNFIDKGLELKRAAQQGEDPSFEAYDREEWLKKVRNMPPEIKAKKKRQGEYFFD